MLEKVDLRIRQATESDLPALEWDGEYIHFRRVYREAMKEVKKEIDSVMRNSIY